MNPNKVCLLRVDKRLLIDLLRPDGTKLFKSWGMPEDAELLGVTDCQVSPNIILLKIWSDQFEEVTPGGAIPYMDVQFSCIDVKQALSFDNARNGELSWGSAELDALLRAKDEACLACDFPKAAELRDQADKLKKKLQESVRS